jgi:hypothetical protein
MPTFVTVYLALGILIGAVLYGRIAIASVRRVGTRGAARSALETLHEELPLYWRIPVASWTFVIGVPLIAVWATLTGDFDVFGALALAAIWLFYLWLLRWHYRAKARLAREPRRA